MAITEAIKNVLTVKIKPRYDSYSDQFSRIFLVKMMMIGALLVGLNWYNDKITCVIPGSFGINGGFVASACWINGFYVYEDIRYHANEIGYYGVPRDINLDGMLPDGEFCGTTDGSHKQQENCKPMEKTFFLQYQYMTFVLAALALLYYAPYGFFRLINQDMVSLKGSIAKNEADPIVANYFSYNVNSEKKMRARVFGNVIVKGLYILSNVAAFLLTNSVLNGGFKQYGIEWANWSKLKNSMAYDYMGRREYPKPGNALLPSFGLCEVHEAAQDVRTMIINKHRFVCELSQHILYQYVFIVLWFTMVFGIVVSGVGLLIQLVDHVITATCFLKGAASARKMYKKLTLRECEYLEFIRRQNMPLYGQVLNKLKAVKLDGLNLLDNEDLQMDNFKGTLA